MSSASDQDHAAVPSAPDEHNNSGSIDLAARDARRKARAKAFLREKPKAGKAWASRQYEYERADDAQEETK